MNRTEWVRLLLTDGQIHRLPARPWALEAALARLWTELSGAGADTVELVRWGHHTSMGWRFPGLTEIVWSLAASGELVPTREIDGGSYIVDPWHQREVRSRVDALPENVQRAVKIASSYLASLTATPNTSSKIG